MTKNRRSCLKFLAHVRRPFRDFWRSNSGDWHWLAAKPVPMAGLNKLLWRESVPSLSFFVMLTLSGIISALGLLAGSTATVIGAMIIAPLMGPIIGMAYALAVSNRRLLKRATLTMTAGTIATVVSAIVITWLVGLRTLSPEVMARTQPTLIDLGVALAAGAAGAFAKSRRHVADSFPGVAIAVALVPPLSVVGIGIALVDTSVWSGALLLFVTNLIAVIFSGILVFLWQRYGSIERAQSGLAVSLMMLMILGVPLAFSLRNLLVKANARQQIVQLINEQIQTEEVDIASIVVQQQRDGLLVEIEVTAPLDSITEADVQQTQIFLSRELDMPITLHAQIIPMRTFMSTPSSPAEPLE
jgi:uncharacterized hydrophobic protein (TIGR00271 family)